ncbi:MAG: prepilin peptidase [Planctomycetes bacterium]|nr:prepilin peptidase [Planctomycetota bacterium]
MDDTFLAWFSSWTVGVFFLALGLCVGSFLNVCIYRLPAGLSIVRPASHCMACRAHIAWYDNIPVASYFILRGRCRRCGAPFSVRYMLVELATGLVWFGWWLAYFKAGLREGAAHPGVYLVHMALASALLASGVIDFDRKEIFTSVTSAALAAGLAGSLAWPAVQEAGAYDHVLPDLTGWLRADALVLSLVGAAVGAGLVNVTRFLGTLAFRREAMGTGDAYLMAAIGGCLGWEAAVLVFLAAPFFGLPYGVWQKLRTRPQAAAEAAGESEGEEEQEEEPPRLGYGTFIATLAGFALLLAAAATGGPAWGTGSRLTLLAGLAAMGASFLFLRQEEAQQGAAEAPAPPVTAADAAREVPYGPFLGMAAGLVMLIQDHAVNYFRPGVEALWHMAAG